MADRKTQEWGSDRSSEEAHLREVLAVVRDNTEKLGTQVREMQAEIDEMLEHYHDDWVEVNVILYNTITLHSHLSRALQKNEKALHKPYFGRIVFWDETLEKEESFYIGKGGISKDATTQVVIDWRAPVANVYYENGLGKCSYSAPEGKSFPIDLHLKRTFEIEEGRLLDYYDSEVVSNDDLLTKYLARNKQAVLGEIVATIQKEQNDIIRRSPYHNMIVQGAAGSGKTTVAMHRISYILYNYEERIKPDDFYIVGSNTLLLNYITSVLPDLDVDGVRQMTLEQLFIRLLYEDWDPGKYTVKSCDPAEAVKGSSDWFTALQHFCDRVEWDAIERNSVFLNPLQFVEGFQNGKTGIFDKRGSTPTPREDLICLAEKEATERYLREHPKISLTSKIQRLNERLLTRVEEEITGKRVKYTEAEKKAIMRTYRNYYSKDARIPSVYELYQSFLREQNLSGSNVSLPDTAFDVYDLAALAYLYKRIRETEVISEAHHIVIDEAQDFGMMAWQVLKFCIYDCTYTVMGDVSQNIHFGSGLTDWEELKAVLLTDPMDAFCVLTKSYRNTIEIAQFATRILEHGQFISYPTEPIIRHGDPVRVTQTDQAGLYATAAAVIKGWQSAGYETIAVICRSSSSAQAAAKELARFLPIREIDLKKAEFGPGVLVLPVEYTKGLEFDAVLILDPSRTDYPADDGHARLLYVAATRALHRLSILYTSDLTGLIADPLPAHRMSGTQPSGQKTGTTEDSDKQPFQPRSQKSKAAAGMVTATHPTYPSANTKPASALAQDVPDTNMKKEAPAPRKRPVAVLSKATLPAASPVSPLTTRYSSGAGSTLQARSSFVGRPGSFSQAHPPFSGEDNHRIAGQDNKTSDRKATMQSNRTDDGKTAMQDNEPIGGRLPGQNTPQKLPVFGSRPSSQALRLPGHSRVDLSVRWVLKQEDGLYLQSRYGILRLSPTGSDIIRVSFSRKGTLPRTTHPGITVHRLEPFWTYRDKGSTVVMKTNELLLEVDKASGAVRFFTSDRKRLTTERDRESRLIEGTGIHSQARICFDWAKGEKLWAMDSVGKLSLPLRGKVQYISREDPAMPSFLYSDLGYGIVPATSSPVACCDLAPDPPFLLLEDSELIDYYFLCGRREHVLRAYAYLCGLPYPA